MDVCARLHGNPSVAVGMFQPRPKWPTDQPTVDVAFVEPCHYHSNNVASTISATKYDISIFIL